MTVEHPILQAVIEHDLARVEQLARDLSGEVDARNELGATPLHAASFDCQEAICEILIRHDADINATNACGDTPLHEASRQGCVEVVKLLLAHGADFECKNQLGWTPLYCSTTATAGCRLVAEFLMDQGAWLDLNSTIRLGRYEHVLATLDPEMPKTDAALFPDEMILDVVCNASRRPDAASMVLSLMQFGANIDGVNYMNETALMIACRDRHLPARVVQILLDAGAATSTKRSTDGSTALRIARVAGHDAAIKLLHLHGVTE